MRSKFLLNSFSTLSFLFAAVTQTLLSAQNSYYPENDQTRVVTTVEFESGSDPIGTSDQFGAVAHFNGASYLVWVDNDYRPWVTKVVNGTPITSPLDANADYKVQADGHHRFSLGVDKDGYIHVSGDMHNYSKYTTAVVTPYPKRYQGQQILYWKSDKPEDISSFTFAGGLNAATAIPGSGFTYPKFFNDNKGDLYFSALMEAIVGGFFPGKMGIGLSAYDTKTKKWTALGGLPDDLIPGAQRNKVLFWEVGGNGGWFQGFQPFFSFDTLNRMHFASAINTDPQFNGNNRLIYAYSEDAGRTWKKTNGFKIGVPIRAADGQANLGDVVATSTTDSFSDSVSVVADINGAPGVFNKSNWYTWDGYNWSLNNEMNFSYPKANFGAIDSVGNLLLYATSPGKIVSAKSFGSPAFTIDLNDFDIYTNVDSYALYKTGVVYGVGIKKANNSLSIVKTTLTSAPLPLDWKHRDIAAIMPNYRGTSSYVNNTFYLTNHGRDIGGPTDSCHYIYKKFSGDGTITARVTADTSPIPSRQRAGLMIRKDLSATSPYVAVLIGPGDNNIGTALSFRDVRGTYANQYTSIPGSVNPYWLRLVRKGDLFTAYSSADGNTWKKVGEKTLVLPASLYIGLAGAASINGYYMQTAKFENVTAP
jgi:regulation of enolase protein 1 (concanavalin A-like superfamily)